MKPQATILALKKVRQDLLDQGRFSLIRDTGEKVFFDRSIKNLKKSDICQALDKLIEEGHRYKHDTTSTVASINGEEQQWVIKRYNHQGFLHTLKLLAGSRALRAFRDGLLLHKLGIATPKPLLYAQSYRYWLPHHSYLINEKSTGETLHGLLMEGKLNSANWPGIVEKVTRLVEKLHSLRITHGDIKQTNLLLTEGEIEIIDLDSLRIHSNNRTFEHFKNKDLKALHNRINTDPDVYVAYKKVTLGLT